MEITKLKKAYFIGIKGVGMTMLAQYLSAKGVTISGSDVSESFMTDPALSKAGISVLRDFNEDNLPADADLIVYSTAYTPQNNIEVAKALSAGRKVMAFPEALGRVFNRNYGIAVAGSHGKTTTTALLGYLLEQAGQSPSVMVGAYVGQFEGNALVGSSDILVLEVDEYQNKLKYYEPKAVLLNNIDYDHPDFFPTRESYTDVFIEFLKKIPPKGFLIANYDDPIVRKIAKSNTRCKVLTYAIDNLANYIAYDIREQDSRLCFKVKFNYDAVDASMQLPGENDIWAPLGDFCLALSGRHNAYNALAVIAAAIELDVGLLDIRKALDSFAGVARRMQLLGHYRGAAVYDDYAHHPSEIKATLEGARSRHLSGAGRLVVVFHPHTYSRTKALLREFSESFAWADLLVVLDIYGSAREEQGGAHSKDLIKRIQKFNGQSGNPGQLIEYAPTLADAERYLRKNLERGDTVILMGAGDVFRIGEGLVKD